MRRKVLGDWDAAQVLGCWSVLIHELLSLFDRGAVDSNLGHGDHLTILTDYGAHRLPKSLNLLVLGLSQTMLNPFSVLQQAQ